MCIVQATICLLDVCILVHTCICRVHVHVHVSIGCRMLKLLYWYVPRVYLYHFWLYWFVILSTQVPSEITLRITVTYLGNKKLQEDTLKSFVSQVQKELVDSSGRLIAIISLLFDLWWITVPIKCSSWFTEYQDSNTLCCWSTDTRWVLCGLEFLL